MRCLVTGADGFLGANLCKELIRQGHEVTGTSLHRQSHTSMDALRVGCRLEFGDVTDYSFVERVINSSEADWIFHLAAVSIVRKAEVNPALALRTNINGTLNILEAGKGRKVIIASSDKAYGDHNGKPYTEDMSLEPTGAYEVSKACADVIAQLYDAVIVRSANVYGPGDMNFSRLIPNSCRRSVQGLSPQVYGDAITQKREWIYVDDAVSAYIHLASNVKNGAYNVGSGEQYTPLEIVQMISEMTRVKYSVDKKENKFYEIPVQILDCSKIHSIGWKAEKNIKVGIYNTVKWYKEYLCAS